MAKRVVFIKKLVIRVLTARSAVTGLLLGFMLSYLSWGNLLLLMAGDVERNPGPGPGDNDGPSANLRQTTLRLGASRDRNTAAGVIANHPVYPELTLADLMGKLSNMEYTVNEKLDGVRTDVNLKLDSIKEDVNKIRHQVGGLQRDMNSLSDHVGSLQKENEILRKENDKLSERLTRVERKADDLEGGARRNNLLFYGLDREDNETANDCEERLRELCTDQLELAEDIEFDRVHRVGTKQNAPIIARCTHYKDKIKILRAKQKLKGTPVFIDEDFSERVRGVRKKLRKIRGELSKSGKRVTVVYDYLMVDGKKCVLDADGESVLVEGQ